jgi:hypothetical protein
VGIVDAFTVVRHMRDELSDGVTGAVGDCRASSSQKGFPPMKNAPITAAKTAAHDAGRTARETATNPWSTRLARCGFATRGVIYLLIGVLAGKAAIGAGGKTTDNTGALVSLYQQPFGRFLTGVVAIGLFAYALWLFVAAALDPERKGTEVRGIGARIAFAIVGCSYAGLGMIAVRLVLHRGTGRQSSDASAQDWTARLLAHPLGAAVVVLIGLIALGAAGFFFYQAFTARFRDELNMSEARTTERQWVVPLGRVGYAALGVVNTIIGLFLIIAAVRHNAGEAKGLGGALNALTQRRDGALLLGIVAIGLIAYGVYSFVEARYRQLVRT